MQGESWNTSGTPGSEAEKDARSLILCDQRSFQSSGTEGILKNPECSC